MSFSRRRRTGRIVLDGFEEQDADQIERELESLGVRSEIIERSNGVLADE